MRAEPTDALVVVGGVGQLYQGDLDLGRRAVARLAGEDLGDGVVVEDLHYGAVAVAQFLEDLSPHTLVLIGAEERGREPATVERRIASPEATDAEQAQDAVAGAAVGYVSVDLVIEVAAALGALPDRTVVVEVEPATTTPSDELSPEARAALEQALELVRDEVHRAPVLELADRLRPLAAEDRLEPSPALEALQRVLAELEHLDREGRWGRTFAERDALRLRISEGLTGEGMDHRDWGLWWALIEELDRLERLEAL